MQDASTLIPDSSITPPKDSGGAGKSNGIADVLMLVAIIMLASSLAISVGVFLYAKLTSTKLKSQKESLNKVKNSFDDRTISELKLLSRRLTVGKEVIEKHIAPSEIFRILEGITLKSVQFVEFKFQSAPPDVLKINLKGKALSVNAVAAQSKAFAANNDKFANVIFSDLGFEKDGTISFRVTADVDPEFINFQNLILRQNERPNNNPGNQNLNLKTNNFNAPLNQAGQGAFNGSGQNMQGNQSQGNNAAGNNPAPETDEFGIIIDN